MNIDFKNWLVKEEENSPILLPPSIQLGKKRTAEESPFCKHNPQINEFSKDNSTNMFLVLSFVVYTMQKAWPNVRQTFPAFIKWVFEKAIPEDNWDYGLSKEHPDFHLVQQFQLLGHQFEQGKGGSSANRIRYLWQNRKEIFAKLMNIIETHKSLPDLEMFRYLSQEVPGFGMAKAAFAVQLIMGKFGCIDSINIAAFDQLIRKDIQAEKKTGKKSAFSISPKTKEVSIKKPSMVGVEAYQRFLDSLEKLHDQSISQTMWDDWCDIVANKVIYAGTGETIKLTLNNKDFEIQPYRGINPELPLGQLQKGEKEFIKEKGKEGMSPGEVISLGHLEPFKAGAAMYRDKKTESVLNKKSFK